MKHIISLGAGVQSSTIALMAKHGELASEIDGAVFADTQNESVEVYEWLNWLEKQVPFPIYRITKGNLAETLLQLRVSAKGNKYLKPNIPVFILRANGTKGMMRRQCTETFKIEMIRKQIQIIRQKQKVMQYIGISTDEAIRMKDSDRQYLVNTYPLIEKGMSRWDCLQWMSDKGYPRPPRSACVYCPYHSNEEWYRLKTEDPNSFAYAVAFEIKLQTMFLALDDIDGVPYLHEARIPLSEIQFDVYMSQPNMFGNECAGVCGV